MPFSPRPYQIECRKAINDGFRLHDRQLIKLPTGAGKTNQFAWTVEDMLPGKSLVLCHRRELIQQAAQGVRETTGIWPQIEMADERASLTAHCVVGSVQTMTGKRLHRWPQNNFKFIACDEAHHSTSDIWQDILSYFTGAKVLGVTATPDRNDERLLGNYYQNIPFQIGMMDLIRDGYLSPIVIKSVPLNIDASGVTTSKGDFDAASLGSILDKYLPHIAVAIKEFAPTRRTVVFLPLISTSKKMCAELCAAGLKAEHVDGESPDRAEILKRFTNGETQILCNAMLLTEGWNCPVVDCIVNLRITRSENLYRQIVGRGTRIYPGKQNLLLLDFIWQHTKHELCTPATLISNDKELKKAIDAAAIEKGLQWGEEDLDLQGLASEVQAQRELALAKELEKQKRKEEKQILVNGSAMMLRAFAIANEKQRGPGGHMATPPQLLRIEQARLHPRPEILTRSEASRIIGAAFYGHK